MEGGAVGHNFDRETHKDHSIFGKLIWFSGYKREDLNLIFYTFLCEFFLSTDLYRLMHILRK
jgi:hypothetical protein